MQTGGGIWYPRGGTRAVPEALVKLGEELGVEPRIVESRHRTAVESERARREDEVRALQRAVSKSDLSRERGVGLAGEQHGQRQQRVEI